MEEESQNQGSNDPDRTEVKENPSVSQEAPKKEHKVEKKSHHESKKVYHSNTPKKSSSMDQDTINKVLIGAAVIQILLLIFVAFQVSSSGSVAAGDVRQAPSAPSAPPAPEEQFPKVAEPEELMDDDPVLGDPDAPVTIIEFSDYECPFCGRFFTGAYPQIKENYIETGKVKLVFRDFPLSFHKMAEPAAAAANCAAPQDKFWEYHDLVFENQAALSEARLSAFARELGLDMAEWEECRNDPATRAEIAKDMAEGQRAGIQGTPAFLVNGRLVSGALPYAVFEALIEEELN